MYNGITKIINKHNIIDIRGCTDVILFYNPITNRFSINNSNIKNLIPIAGYNLLNHMIGFNKFPDMVRIEEVITPRYETTKFSFNFNEARNAIEWNTFHAVDTLTWEVVAIEGGSFKVSQHGFYFMIINPNNKSVEVILDPQYLPKNSTIINAFVYSRDGIILDYDKINGKHQFEERLSDLEDLVDKKVLEENSTLILTNEIYKVDNNQILTSCLTIAYS